MTGNKVLLINSNQEVNPNPVLPVGMAYVASSLAKNEFEVSCADLCFKKRWKSYLKEKIKAFSPDFIGISIRNIDNHDQSMPKLYLEFVKEIISFCKLQSKAKIFCGGAALAVMPELILDYLDLEFGIFGDGEEVTPKFLQSYSIDKKDFSLPGLVYKRNNKIYSNKAIGIKDMDSISYHELEKWIDLTPYFNQETSYPVQAKRGCPFDCIYCTYARGEGKCYRFRNSKLIAQEIIDFDNKYKPKTIEFVDSIFNHPEGFAEEICRELIKQKSKAKLHTIELNPTFLSPELIKLMEDAGFVSCGITCESASDKMLENLKKSYTVKDINMAAKNLRNSKMKRLWIFLFGGPGEDANTVEETLKFIREELGENDIVFFNIGIRIYPGTEISDIALKEGIINKNTNLLYPVFYISKKITRKEIEEKIKNENNSNIVTIKDLRLPYLSYLLRIASFLKIKGPYWSYTPILNKIRSILCLK